MDAGEQPQITHTTGPLSPEKLPYEIPQTGTGGERFVPSLFSSTTSIASSTTWQEKMVFTNNSTTPTMEASNVSNGGPLNDHLKVSTDWQNDEEAIELCYMYAPDTPKPN
eukprot:15350580-Ditylum_brightwellii.AAC.1